MWDEEVLSTSSAHLSLRLSWGRSFFNCRAFAVVDASPRVHEPLRAWIAFFLSFANCFALISDLCIVGIGTEARGGIE